MNGVLQDLRFAMRSLVRRPGFAVLSISILALGIGVTAAVFCVSHTLLFQSLPYQDADRVMVMWRLIEGIEEPAPFSFPTIEDLEARNRAFESLAVFVEKDLNLTGADGEPERLHGMLVSHRLLGVLGVDVAAGRGFSARDDQRGAERTVLLSHQLWTRRFGADESLLSRQVTLDGLQYTVVGILKPELNVQKLGQYTIGDFWVPIELFHAELPHRREESPGLLLAGRLKPEVSPAAGRQDVERIAGELADKYPHLRKSQFTAVKILDDVVGEIRPTLYLLLGAVGFVLLLACADLANLLLTHGARRRQEFATRTAVGASRWRVVRQVMCETLVLAMFGSVVGLVLAGLSLEVMAAKLLPGATFHNEFSIGWPVLVFTLTVTLVAVVAASLVPALQASNVSFQANLTVRSPQSLQRFEKVLVGVEVAIALVLLIGAFLMFESLMRLRDQDPGFEPSQVLSTKVTLPMPKYAAASSWVSFFDQALVELAGLPGVSLVAMTSSLPLVGDEENMSPVAAGDRALPQVRDLPSTRYQIVSPRFFEAMGIPLIHGRDFSSFDDDRGDAKHVVIINQALARHFWPDPTDEVIGQRIAFELDGTVEAPEFLWREVIGVVGDVRHSSLRSASRHAVYAPYTQPGLWFEGEWPTVGVVVKSEGEPRALVPAVRASLLSIDPDQPVDEMQSLAAAIEIEVGQLRAIFTLLISFAGLAAVLALIGVYGIVAQAVAGSVREIGTRVALGATPSQVVGELLKRNLLLVGIGLAVGLAAAAGVSRWLSSLLYGIGSLDPRVYSMSVGGLALAALLATLVPAWKAARISPSEALRQD